MLEELLSKTEGWNFKVEKLAREEKEKAVFLGRGNNVSKCTEIRNNMLRIKSGYNSSFLTFKVWQVLPSSADLSHKELIRCVKEIKSYPVGNGIIKIFLKWIKIFYVDHSGYYVEEEFKGDKTLDKEGN